MLSIALFSVCRDEVLAAEGFSHFWAQMRCASGFTSSTSQPSGTHSIVDASGKNCWWNGFVAVFIPFTAFSDDADDVDG